MDKNINLDSDTIFNKEFNVHFKGYSTIEVDQFLDLVAHDYDVFDKKIAELKEKLSEADDIIENLKIRNMDLENKLAKAEEAKANSSTSSTVNNLSQVDILRRLARLEQEVFNRK